MKNSKKFLFSILCLGLLLNSCQNEELSNEDLSTDASHDAVASYDDVKVISDYMEVDGELIPVLDVDVSDLPDLDATRASAWDWMKGEEGDCKGHTIEKHWNKSKSWLERRSIVKTRAITSFADDDVNAFYPDRDATATLIRRGFDAAVDNGASNPKDGAASSARVLNVKNVIGRGYDARGKSFKSAISKFAVFAKYSKKLGRWFLISAYPIY